MTPADFRRIVRSFEGVEEVEHAGLPAADEAVLTGALRTAWQLRVQQNGEPRRKR
jgi:hypothetical protein